MRANEPAFRPHRDPAGAAVGVCRRPARGARRACLRPARGAGRAPRPAGHQGRAAGARLARPRRRGEQPRSACVGAAQAARSPGHRHGARARLPLRRAGRRPAARFARATLAQAPGVHLLVTSQLALKVDGEQVFRLDPLSVPDSRAGAAEALGHGAVALFAEQARAADRRFALTDANVDAVIALCRGLDGVPLAIKLASARLPLLGLHGLASRLGDRLRLLRNASRDAPTRQQTLLAALHWSHGLLGLSQQAVFRRLGVFAGGFPLEMVAAVACDDTLDEWAAIDTLAELVDRSLVAIEHREPPRYRLLEATRDYARIRLEEAHEDEATQQRHAHATAALMDAAYETYWSTPDREWLDRHAVEIDNVRAALAWSERDRPELALRLIGSASVL